MRTQSLLLSLAFVALAACATPPQGAAPGEAVAVAEARKPATDDGMLCRMESTIGSNRMKRVCRPIAEVEESARKNQDAMRRLQRTGGRAGDN